MQVYGKGSDYMEMPRGLKMLKDLRNGQVVICPKCDKGHVISVGDCKTTRVFHCDKCDYSFTLD